MDNDRYRDTADRARVAWTARAGVEIGHIASFRDLLPGIFGGLHCNGNGSWADWRLWSKDRKPLVR